MNVFLVGLALAAAAIAANGEPGPVVQIDFSNPGLVPSQWTLELHPDGVGHFHSQRGSSNADSVLLEAPDIDRDVQLSPHFAEHVFQVAERKKLFHVECESHLKVAFQGTKKLTYTGPRGQGSCQFNYSKDPEIESLGDSLVSVANTVIEGARLQTLLQHDRLGLDHEMETLVESATDGRAQQIGSIRDILERLADDPAVLERVRKRARTLLERAND